MALMREFLASRTDMWMLESHDICLVRADSVSTRKQKWEKQ